MVLLDYAQLAGSTFGFVVNITALFVIGRKKSGKMFHSLIMLLMAYDALVVVCSALIFSLKAVWEEFNRDVFPIIAPWLLPLMHIAVMGSVYCTILIR